MRLDHVNIHAGDQEAMRDFLVAVLGLTVGWRPGFSFRGYWLYIGEEAVIHLQDKHTLPPGEGAAGWVDHVAFRADAPPDTERRRLRSLAFPFVEARLPDTDIVQFFVSGPEGVKVELQCRPVA